jgi:hypothetical protein
MRFMLQPTGMLLARSMPASLNRACHSVRVRQAPPGHMARISIANRPVCSKVGEGRMGRGGRKGEGGMGRGDGGQGGIRAGTGQMGRLQQRMPLGELTESDSSPARFNGAEPVLNTQC